MQNEENFFRLIQLMGIEIQLIDTVLLATVNGINAQNRLLADALTTLDAAQRQILIDAVSRNETQLEQIETSARNFRIAFDALTKNLQ